MRSTLAGYSLGGSLVSGVVGVIGAVIGNWLARTLGLPEPLLVNIQGQQFPIIWSVVGSAILVAIVGVLTRRRRWQKLKGRLARPLRFCNNIA